MCSADTTVSLTVSSVSLTAVFPVSVPSAPTNITYRLLSAEAIELQWRPPTAPHGEITSYIIFYVSNNTKQHLWRNFTKPGNSRFSNKAELVSLTLQQQFENLSSSCVCFPAGGFYPGENSSSCGFSRR